MEGTNTQKTKLASLFRFHKIPFIGSMILLFLTPIFFVPYSTISFSFSKAILLYSLVVLSLCVFIVLILKKGQFELPTNKIYIAILLVPISFLVSSLLSAVPSMSFLGYGFELGTSVTMLVLFVMMFLVANVFKSEQKIFYAYGVFFISSALITFFHAVRFIFGPSALSFGLSLTPTSNTIGSWFDLGIFYGALLLLSLISIEMTNLASLLKNILRVAILVSICFLSIIYFKLIWAVIAVLSIVFFVYQMSSKKVSNDTDKVIGDGGEIVHLAKNINNVRKVSVSTLVVFFVAFAFLLPLGQTLGNATANIFNVNIIEARPSWVSTIDLSKKILKDNALFGVGPNRFASQWNLFKSPEVNQTPFWNTSFDTTVGLIPTFFSTTGIFGLISWLLFFALFLYCGFISLFARDDGGLTKYFTVSSFFLSLYFWIMMVVYTPSITLVISTFFFTGLFFATAYKNNIINTRTISFSSFPRTSFAFILVLVLSLVSTVSVGYLFAEKVVASYFLQKSIIVFSQEGNLDKSEAYLGRAISLNPADINYRALSELQIARLSAFVQKINNAKDVSEEMRNEFQRILGLAIQSANTAVTRDQTNVENWLALGRVYESITPLGVEQAYESAVQAYTEALKRSPTNPSIYLSLARLSAGKKDFEGAKKYIAQALENKSDYSEAIFLKSQIEVAEGNIKGAVASVERIAFISPNDPGVFFELGLLKYNNNDFVGAVGALERAVSLVPDYSNAKYFLGLSYSKLGRVQDAIVQFESIEKSNPDNTEIKLILKNLNAGRAPFVNAEPPVDDKPEKRGKLPVEEKKS